MKLMIVTASMAALSASMAMAGGPVFVPNDPGVIAPARTPGDWTGPYAGVSYGRVKASTSETSFTEQCFKFDDKAGERFSDTPVDCETYTPPDGYSLERVRVPGETTETSASSSEFGAFAGYRHQFSNSPFTIGAELSVLGDFRSAEAQAGLGFGKVLAYGFIGAGALDEDSGMVYGVGADTYFGKVLVGAKYVTSDFGVDTAMLRVGIKF